MFSVYSLFELSLSIRDKKGEKIKVFDVSNLGGELEVIFVFIFVFHIVYMSSFQTCSDVFY